MKENFTINGEAVNDSLTGTLAVVEFLKENYQFRYNVLNGKVEFINLKVETANDQQVWRPLTEKAVNSIVLKARCEQIAKGSPKTEICEYVDSEEVPLYDPIREYLDNLPKWDGQNHVAKLFSRIPGISSEQLEFLCVWIRSSVATTNNPHPLTDVTGSRRFICMTVPEGQFIDNSGEIDYDQLYAQIMYELIELKAPYWFNNDQVARIQELNLNYMAQTDMGEMVKACFRKPKEGEKVKSLGTEDLLKVIKNEFPSVKTNLSTKGILGRTMKELGFEKTEHSHVAHYKAIPRKAA